FFEAKNTIPEKYATCFHRGLATDLHLILISLFSIGLENGSESYLHKITHKMHLTNAIYVLFIEK
ncbi:MAG: hypothetical protein Q8763_02685, partial [Candidatus Phytoplasma australasiaticum]|nr:hypothetical protein [Candidatus Phytoplasma australasiaticum]